MEYRIDGFLDTSRDKVSDDLMTLIDSCCGGFFSKSTVPPPPSSTSKATTPAPPRSNTVKSQTLGKKFKIQLESLLTVLTTTSPHYIKCIKPNTMKVPNCFQGTTCFAQLQALGIFEAVAIRKRGFPYRVPHEEFNRVYSPLFKQQLIAKNALKASGKIKAEILVSELNKLNGPDAVHHFLIGKSKVFAKFEARDAAKKLLENYQIGCAIKIQRMTRGFVARMAFCDFCYAALDANTLLSVPDPDNEKYLDEVEVLLKKLQRFPYQHYQRLLEMKSRIHDRLSLLKEIEDMQSVPFSAINSKWMSKAQYARKKGIMTSAAERVYEMYDTIMRGEGEDTPDLDEEPLDLNTKESVLKSEGHVQEVTTQDFKEIELPPVSRLICSLCRKQYEPPPLKRSPRYLSCLHVFCSVCLADRMERTSGGIMCPNSDCRVLSRCPDGLTSFKIAYALVHQLPPICRNCESKNSVCICLDCPVDSSLLCMACLKSHNKIKAYKHHSVHGLDSDTPVHPHDMSRCIHHPEKDLDAYCRTCQQLVCLSCAVFHHANHTIQPYQQAAEIERSRLLPCFSELLSDISSLQSKQRDLHETEPQLELQNKTMKELLNRIFQSLHHTLANRRTDFLSVLDVYYTQKRKALVDYSEALNYHITCQESSSKICSEMLDLGNDTEVLSVSRFLHTHLDDMLQNSWQQDLSNLETTLSFSCGPEHDAKNLISSIGICKGSLICADPTKSTLEVLQIGEFCQQWQVLIRLTLRNIKGQKLTKGGHAVTIDVDEITESPIHSHTPSISPHTPDNSMITTPSPPAPPPLSTPVPHGLGKLSTRSPTSFTLKSAQQSVPSPTNTVEIQPSTQTNQRTKTSKFNTGLTDNQDGTYHLLVTSIPSPSSGGDNTPSNHSLPQAINVSIKVFGINVHESPLLFHPHDANEMKSYHTNRITSQTNPHIPPAPSSSNGTSTEFTSVSTFLKYISGGLISA